MSGEKHQRSRIDNPYVGPRPFQRDEKIFGRDREARELVSLMIAERIVLLYSPSGAGKTSLINAAVGPALEKKEFVVFPSTRLGARLGEPDTRNPYIASTLLSLEKDVPAEERISRSALKDMRFPDYLDLREGRLDQRTETVLIFDQFEEILTLDPLDEDARVAFFEEVGEALRDPTRWALFAMREDYLPAIIDRYADAIPTRFRTAYRLDLLTPESARPAIREPARARGVEFEDGAVDKVVEDLRRMDTRDAAGDVVERPGPFIEPVQLQVVCCRLWEKPDDTPGDIREDEIGSSEDLDAGPAEYMPNA